MAMANKEVEEEIAKKKKHLLYVQCLHNFTARYVPEQLLKRISHLQHMAHFVTAIVKCSCLQKGYPQVAKGVCKISQHTEAEREARILLTGLI